MSDFTMVAGDARDIEIPVADETGAALNLAGYTVRWGLFNMAGAKLLEKTLAAGGVVVDAPSSGVILVPLEPLDTSGKAGLFRHECEITDGNSKPYTVAQGEVEIKRGYL